MDVAPTAQRKSIAGGWVWLIPATYLVHIAEEQWGGEGFPVWITRMGGAHYAPAHFLQLNGLAWLLLLIGVVLALKVGRLRWLIISFGTVILLNGLAHLIGSIVTNSYSPGLFSGLLLWVPLGAYTLVRAWKRARHRTFWVSVIVGFVIHSVVTLIAFSGGKI